MEILTLSLKKQWFDLIARGIKLEEYREINDYWTVRLQHVYKNNAGMISSYMHYPEGGEVFKKFEKVVFTLGYPKAEDTSRRLEFKNPKIRIDYGRAEWGAKMRTRYFVITWDKPEGK